MRLVPGTICANAGAVPVTDNDECQAAKNALGLEGSFLPLELPNSPRECWWCVGHMYFNAPGIADGNSSFSGGSVGNYRAWPICKSLQTSSETSLTAAIVIVCVVLGLGAFAAIAVCTMQTKKGSGREAKAAFVNEGGVE